VAAALGSSDPRADDRPTIVFLHGTRLTGAQWAVQLATLGDDFHCIALDLPGHGEAAAIPFTMDDAAERVAGQIRDQAHDGKAVLVGLSLGGFVAMEVAARWPERVSALVICGATGEPGGVRSLGYRGLAALFGRAPLRVLEATNRWYLARWRSAPSSDVPSGRASRPIRARR
jgi:pimeloyl-ACP methyl ester carboxylesterase